MTGRGVAMDAVEAMLEVERLHAACFCDCTNLTLNCWLPPSRLNPRSDISILALSDTREVARIVSGIPPTIATRCRNSPSLVGVITI